LTFKTSRVNETFVGLRDDVSRVKSDLVDSCHRNYAIKLLVLNMLAETEQALGESTMLRNVSNGFR
jgi:hypothetical protein